VFLAALYVTSEGLRAVSLGEHVPESTRSSAATTVFRSANLNAAREQVMLLAQTPVVRAADRTYNALRELRDVVGQEHDHDSPSYREVLLRYQRELKTLRTTCARTSALHHSTKTTQRRDSRTPIRPTHRTRATAAMGASDAVSSRKVCRSGDHIGVVVAIMLLTQPVRLGRLLVQVVRLGPGEGSAAVAPRRASVAPLPRARRVLGLVRLWSGRGRRPGRSL
jgi:hypothetical protein